MNCDGLGNSTLLSFSTFQSLILLYLVGVIYMVRRQVRQVWAEEEEAVGKVVITNRAGSTNIRSVDKIVNDEEEVLL